MALTREFKETIGARIERDPRLREASKLCEGTFIWRC